MEGKQQQFRVVVGVDLTSTCNHAILEAMRLADRSTRAIVHFVHVLEESADLHDADRIDRLSDQMGQTMARVERHVRDVLYVAGIEAGWGSELMYHVRVGPVARELQQVAVDTDADLIVVGQPRAGAIRRILAKSAAAELVRDARVAVVVARPKDFAGLAKSPVPEPPRPGQDLTQSGTFATVEFIDSGRSTHIAGMI